MRRKIINIDGEKCNGCGLCIDACHEGAIKIIDGKASLISDKYCDGLGDCLPACPMGAIGIIEREAEPYSEEAVQGLLKQKKPSLHQGQEPETEKEVTLPCGCPSMMETLLVQTPAEKTPGDASGLNQWPIQLKLVNPAADYFKEASILVAADCTAYAYGDFHRDLIRDRIVLIGCPKLDDNKYYQDKLKEILSKNEIKSITVVRMEVPCCGGIISTVREAMLNSRTIVPCNEIVLSTKGEIKK